MSPVLHDTLCVITDVQMPGMNGLELQATLVAGRPNLPIIVLTAFPEEHIRRRAEATGAVGFFAKPVDSSAIIECLNRALKRR